MQVFARVLEDGLFVGEGVGGRWQEVEALLTRQGFLSTAIRVKWSRAVLVLLQVGAVQSEQSGELEVNRNHTGPSPVR